MLVVWQPMGCSLLLPCVSCVAFVSGKLIGGDVTWWDAAHLSRMTSGGYKADLQKLLFLSLNCTADWHTLIVPCIRCSHTHTHTLCCYAISGWYHLKYCSLLDRLCVLPLLSHTFEPGCDSCTYQTMLHTSLVFILGRMTNSVGEE